MPLGNMGRREKALRNGADGRRVKARRAGDHPESAAPEGRKGRGVESLTVLLLDEDRAVARVDRPRVAPDPAARGWARRARSGLSNGR